MPSIAARADRKYLFTPWANTAIATTIIRHDKQTQKFVDNTASLVILAFGLEVLAADAVQCKSRADPARSALHLSRPHIH